MVKSQLKTAIRQVSLLSVSTVKCVLHQHELRGCCVERNSSSRRSTFKIYWSLLLITWTKAKIFWRKTLWSHGTKTFFSYSEQQDVWRREGEALHPKNTIPNVKHGVGRVDRTAESLLRKLKQECGQLIRQCSFTDDAIWQYGIVWYSIWFIIKS